MMLPKQTVMDSFIKEINKGAVEIIAKPNSKKNKIVLTKKGFIVEIKQKAQNNKANENIEQFLTKITQKKVKIISGKTSKKKLVKLSNRII